MEKITENKFKELYLKDLGKNVEVLEKTFKNEKTGYETKIYLNYISWAYAVKVLKEEYPEAGYRHISYNGLPYLESKAGAFVGVELWLTKQDRKEGFTETYVFPVLDFKMKSVPSPNSFQVNTAHQRCLSKLISIVTGLGLNVYTGEDINALRYEEASKNDAKERELEEKLRLEAERLASERKKLDEAIALDEKKALEKAKVWNEFYEKMKETLSNKTFKSVSEYVEFIEITYLRKSPQLKENQGFKGIFEAFMPKAKVLENKASQVNKFDKCNTCSNETDFCICDIDKKAPVLAKV